jgi:hypothetical protein
MTHLPKSNTVRSILKAGLDYVELLLSARVELSGEAPSRTTIPPFQLPREGSWLLNQLEPFEPAEQLVLFLALVPHFDPELPDRALRKLPAGKERLIPFGGLRGKQHRGILPNGETALFLLGGQDVASRTAVREFLRPEAPLFREGLLRLLPPPPGEPPMAGQLIAEADFVDRILHGRSSLPSFSPAFPAQQLETELNWADLVLPERAMNEIGHLRAYLDLQERLSDRPAYGRHNRKGYRALFYGPPGTGKTLTAALLGKETGRPVFRVDLSMVVSKYIGETEKNLAGLFQRAEHKRWILFFDEADALFSKRGEVKESRDKYANQETSFLLQRVENYDGLCILASNFRNNLDKAFTRRFEAMVPFQLPSPEERLQLWRSILPEALPLAEEVDLPWLARRYELTGAGIANAVRHAVYAAVSQGEDRLSRDQLQSAIRREYEKEDRLFAVE